MNSYDEDAMAEAVTLMASKPQTIGSLARRFGKSERTIKRWLAELRSRGIRVVRDGVDVDSPYMIIL